MNPETPRPQASIQKTVPAPQTLPPATTSPTPIAPQPLASPGSLQVKKNRHAFRWIGVIVAVFLTLAVLAAGGVYAWYSSQLSSPNPGSTETVRVTVASGNTATDVATQLAKNNMIKNEFVFEIYYRLHQQTGLKAGVYVLERNMSVGEIVAHLESGKPDEFALTFLPGGTLTDAKRVLATAGYPMADIEAAMQKTYSHPLLIGRPAGADLEGYIYGDTYNFYTGSSLDDVLKKLFDHMYEDIKAKGLEQAYAAQGMSLYEGITFASIVQSEVSSKADMPLVSQVFHKRLAEDTVLGSDVTFIYGARKLGVAPAVNLDSPYNTRVRKGLPPTPVSNPGIDALQAGAKPASTDYMYFVAGDDGKTYFSKTNEEHEQATRDHCMQNCILPSQ
ncbi:endolytic transglycosylase MltG [Candidatus Saccharibacteria bacterium]|nr:endolytic transglycosylase MltG [Candidatus Saccharibacteria bacterium]MBH2007366.1 endolytic transglycosylase MltG [Candidatus Saccharibacteria bacterium]